MTPTEIIDRSIYPPGGGDADDIVNALTVAGYVIVPREPTTEMVKAGIERPRGMTDWTKAMRVAWSAMVEAAPH